jgi:C-terminal processing protease CtpA/Prc
MKVQRIHTDHTKFLVILGIALLLTGLTSAVFAEKTSRSGYLGVGIERVSNAEKKELGISHGVLVTEVIEDSPAEKAGLLEEDIILYFNGKKIRRTDNLIEAVREVKPDTEVRVTVLRGKERKDITVKVGKKRTASGVLSWRSDDGLITMLTGNRGYLGVEMRDLNEDLAGYFGVKADEGVLVVNVVEDSPADKAGMKAGDVMLSIDGEDVGEAGDVYDILHDFEPGDKVDVTVMRHQKKQSFKIELDEQDHHSGIRMLQMQKGDKPGQLRDYYYRTPDFENMKAPDRDLEIILKKNLKNLDEKLQRIPEKLNERLEVIKEHACI